MHLKMSSVSRPQCVNKLSISRPVCHLCHLWSPYTLQWRHNGCDGVSNHQSHKCLLDRLFKLQIKENIKASRHWLCEGNSPVTGEFLAQRASNAENVSIWWRHHDQRPTHHGKWLISGWCITWCYIAVFHTSSYLIKVIVPLQRQHRPE